MTRIAAVCRTRSENTNGASEINIASVAVQPNTILLILVDSEILISTMYSMLLVLRRCWLKNSRTLGSIDRI